MNKGEVQLFFYSSVKNYLACSKRLDKLQEIQLLKEATLHERLFINKNALDKRDITSRFLQCIILNPSLIPRFCKLPSCFSNDSHIFQRQNFEKYQSHRSTWMTIHVSQKKKYHFVSQRGRLFAQQLLSGKGFRL